MGGANDAKGGLVIAAGEGTSKGGNVHAQWATLSRVPAGNEHTAPGLGRWWRVGDAAWRWHRGDSNRVSFGRSRKVCGGEVGRGALSAHRCLMGMAPRVRLRKCGNDKDVRPFWSLMKPCASAWPAYELGMSDLGT
jgi:hypothetical protein